MVTHNTPGMIGMVNKGKEADMKARRSTWKNAWIRRCRKLKACWFWVIGSLCRMFDPFIVIGFICAVMLVVTMISTIVMQKTEIDHGIPMAIMTGVWASGVLAVFMEMANNYRRNTVREVVLSKLLSFLVHYDSNIERFCGRNDRGRILTDMRRNVAKGKKDTNTTSMEDDEDDLECLCMTKSAAILSLLPEAIPLVKDAYENHSGEMKRKEVISLSLILMTYDTLISIVSNTLYCLTDSPEIEEMYDMRHKLSSHVYEQLMEYMEVSHKNNRYSDELLRKIAESIIQEGDASLKRLGIVLSDDIQNESIDTENAVEEENEIGFTLSMILYQIDTDIRELQKLAIRAPGYNMIYSWNRDRYSKYRDQ